MSKNIKVELLVGIDPGTTTGFAVWSRASVSFVSISSMTIHRAMEMINNMRMGQSSFEVWFEDARQRHYFAEKGKEVLLGAGSIRRDCNIWEDFLTDKGIVFRAIPPANIKTKMESQTFKLLTKWNGKTNEHSRDAAIIIFKG
ncbi:MAG: hypothetical protein UV51_C0007G0009 [Candidatus Woesebacteria bacterium GW2011_GWC1_42_9]|nr:MAG: hypothetical protein UV51_C0007G0009 [Candidatus Woesebacteria bacterium GW2011_GWC1_42_9]